MSRRENPIASTAAAELLRQGENLIERGADEGARRVLARLDSSQSLGSVFAAQILSERLNASASAKTRNANQTRAA